MTFALALFLGAFLLRLATMAARAAEEAPLADAGGAAVDEAAAVLDEVAKAKGGMFTSAAADDDAASETANFLVFTGGAAAELDATGCGAVCAVEIFFEPGIAHAKKEPDEEQCDAPQNVAG